MPGKQLQEALSIVISYTISIIIAAYMPPIHIAAMYTELLGLREDILMEDHVCTQTNYFCSAFDVTL